MITKIRIKNFRQIKDQTIEFKQAVVVVGPNNGGKTTLLQAIALFAVALRAWGAQKVGKKTKAKKRTGVAINLEDVLNISVANFKELWADLNVRAGTTKNVRIEIHAEGYTKNVRWKTGFEFDYGRDSVIYVRLTNNENGEIYEFPEILLEEKIGYLPSVSGLNPVEDKLEIGSILRKIGNGNTADILRNVCFLLYDREDKELWNQFTQLISTIFKVELNPPQYIPQTGLLKMSYNESYKRNLDLSSLGSGTKQAILLFGYLLAFPNTVNLLDEPDAHLEIIRQSNIYDKISDIAKQNNSQLIIASHSESVMNRAFGKDQVISSIFGKFEEVNQPKYVVSVLRNYGYEEFIIAKQRPYLFYFEGTTDLDFIKSFCKKLQRNEVYQFLEEKAYPYPVGNDLSRVRNHFDALKRYIPELRGFALFDTLNRQLESNQEGLLLKQWSRNEIENYIPIPDTLIKFIEEKNYGSVWQDRFRDILYENIPQAALKDREHKFWRNTKISDDLLTPVFEKFFDEFGISRSTMDKSKFYQLVEYVNVSLLDNEIKETIDLMYKHFTYKSART